MESLFTVELEISPRCKLDEFVICDFFQDFLFRKANIEGKYSVNNSFFDLINGIFDYCRIGN